MDMPNRVTTPETSQPYKTCVTIVVFLRPTLGFCKTLAWLSKQVAIMYQECGCVPAIVVHLMGMLIFIIDDGTSGQCACDCGHG